MATGVYVQAPRHADCFYSQSIIFIVIAAYTTKLKSVIQSVHLKNERAGNINALFLRKPINSLSQTIIFLPLTQFLLFIIFIVNVCCSLAFILKNSIVREPSMLLPAAAHRKHSEKKIIAGEAG